MKKKSFVFTILFAVLVVLGGGWLVWKVFIAEPSFSAVYLTTGDLYFGRLVKFPSYGLKQVYTLQVNPQDQNQPFRVRRFRDIFWGPGDFMRINRDNVVWTVELDPSGQLATLFRENPNLLPQVSPSTQNQPQGQLLPGTDVQPPAPQSQSQPQQ